MPFYGNQIMVKKKIVPRPHKTYLDQLKIDVDLDIDNMYNAMKDILENILENNC